MNRPRQRRGKTNRAKAQKEFGMSRLQIWIPHLKKMAVKDLPPGADPANPPLAEGEDKKAELLLDAIVSEHGEPSAIFTSMYARSWGTSEPARRRYGQHDEGGVLVVGLNTLAQPDSGDVDPTNPKARADGLVIYGPESYSPDWYKWFRLSRDVITQLEELLFRDDDRPIYVFTHRPLVAAARWEARNGNVVPGRNDIDALDTSLLPYCLFRKTSLEGWHEIPRE